MKRSIAGLIWGLLAASIFLVLYLVLTGDTARELYSFIYSNMVRDGDGAMAKTLFEFLDIMINLVLYCFIGQLALAILAWLMRPFNTIMKIFAWFSLIFSGLLFLIPSIFAIIAGSCNSRSFKRMKEAQ